jgi:hypothetical protein
LAGNARFVTYLLQLVYRDNLQASFADHQTLDGYILREKNFAKKGAVRESVAWTSPASDRLKAFWRSRLRSAAIRR